MDSMFSRRKSRHILDLNIVPILDMFISVIFFLLLSTSFIALTKNTLPPSSTVTVSGADQKAPISPKLILKRSGGNLQLKISWQGERPGNNIVTLEPSAVEHDPGLLIEKAHGMLMKFKEQFPEEKTLRIGLSAEMEYQKLVSLMDAARDLIPDAVLISYEEANVPE